MCSPVRLNKLKPNITVGRLNRCVTDVSMQREGYKAGFLRRLAARMWDEKIGDKIDDLGEY